MQMQIQQLPIEPQYIIDTATQLGIPYMDLPDEERLYFTKCVGVIDESPMLVISAIHKQVCKVVEYISKDRTALERILTPKMADVILQRPGPISPRQRYDVIYSKTGMHIVEVNSETPAGLPEVRASLLFDKYTNLVNTNSDMSIERDTQVDVVFGDDGGEDFINASYLAGMYQEGSRMINVEDILFEEDGLYAYNKKIETMHTFYPMERLFEDEGGNQFWDLYIQGKFSMVNGPINLISQSKAFRAWLFENMDMLVAEGIVTDRALFDKYVPRYYFEEKEGTIAKPRLFREGVGIGDNEVEDCVYQGYVGQKEVVLETFEGTKTGYITLGIYCNEEEAIGTYCRFCTEKITDYTAYFLPIYYTQDEKITSLSSISSNVNSRMM